ncbi:MAG: ATP-binding cassette domain-containing protein [Coriobacteriia bacterium]|nr:ATP-binding cassette domain-containing protein [Coriobacteriia bacterium]MBN2840560.1 ATP-binding cassette domain-containing protein [Coriobacteriia bacterium]
MALVADNVSYAYEEGRPFGVDAVRGVGLTLEVGDLLVVAGTTGSGKSTLLRLLAGLLEPSTGSVVVDGVSPGHRDARGAVAIVFQDPETQFFAETLRIDVAFGPRNLGHADAESAADRALSEVGLDPSVYGSRSPFSLSGGEARRGAIAGALAMGARYLLLDEPTAGLDAAGRASIRGALEVERQRSGVIVVTHDPGEFLDSASGIIALDEGRVALSGSVGELYADPSVYERAGLELPPIVRTQLLARASGMPLEQVTLDPGRAAAALVAARGMRS